MGYINLQIYVTFSASRRSLSSCSSRFLSILLDVLFGPIIISFLFSSRSRSANILTISGKKLSFSVSYNSLSNFFFDFLYFAVRSFQSFSVKHTTDHVEFGTSSSEEMDSLLLFLCFFFFFLSFFFFLRSFSFFLLCSSFLFGGSSL